MNRFVWGGNAGSNPATDVGVNFDTLGRVSWVGRNHVGGTAYSYDLADRVTKVQIENNNGQLWSWSYNPAGQVVTKSSSNSAYDQRPPANDNEAHTYDGLNRDAAVTAVSGYDANQNLTTDPVGARSFTYDAENKLVAASGSGTSAAISLSYDPLGRLYQEVATSGGSSTTTQFLYSGDKLAAEYNGAGVMQVRYLHGPGEDQPLIQYGGSSVDGTTAQFLYTDRQGSIVGLQTLTTGQLGTPLTYGPYGEPSSWTASRFGYTGQIEIPEARLNDYKARDYDPFGGRFLQTDPVGYKDNLNPYAYVGGDPLNMSDPAGTEGRINLGQSAGSLEGSDATDLGWSGSSVAQANSAGGASSGGGSNNNQGGSGGNSPNTANRSALRKTFDDVLEVFLDETDRATVNQKYGIAQNRIVGLTGEQYSDKYLQANGYIIIGSHVGMRDSDGSLRIYDTLAWSPSHVLTGIETKTNGAIRTTSQVASDILISTNGGTFTNPSYWLQFGKGPVKIDVRVHNMRFDY